MFKKSTVKKDNLQEYVVQTRGSGLNLMLAHLLDEIH